MSASSVAGPRPIYVRWQAVHWCLYGMLAGLLVLGTVSEVALNVGGLRDGAGTVEFFNLSYEGNFPTFYSALLLASCAGLLGLAGWLARADRRPYSLHWFGLAAIFAYIAVDEAVVIHETLNAPLREYLKLGGALYFAWVLPFAFGLVVLGIVYFSFWLHLPFDVRVQFALAAIIFVGGAMGTEFPIGAWYDANGGSNLAYGLLNLAQEGLEILGASIFLSSLVQYISTKHGTINIALSTTPATPAANGSPRA